MSINNIEKELLHALKQNNWREHHFTLSNGTTFSVCHNMPDTFGLSIDTAFQNWIGRTDEYTVDSFVDYIMSKYYMHGNFAMSKATWDEINA